MDTPHPNVVKMLVAPARYSDGPTLYLICQNPDGQCEIREQMPDGRSIVWPEPLHPGPQQAETAIYRWGRENAV
jgi:hypothetical protein